MAITAERVGGHRFLLANDQVRLDFDLRTCDTMYNYVWVRNPGTDAWERRYNFGVDIGARERGTRDIVNTIGVHLQPRVLSDGDGTTLELTYPAPLVVYRQFEKAEDGRETWSYPDLPMELPKQMRLADASVIVRYRLREGECAWTVDGRHLGGVVENITPILNAMWVDNDDMMTSMHVEHVGDYEWDRPSALAHLHLQDVRYVLFWRTDGRGVPYGAVIEGRQRQHFAPYTNPDGDGIFKTCSSNQDFRPQRAPTTGYNDTNLYVGFEPSRTAPGVRFCLFPELGWGRGGSGDQLLSALRRRIEDGHCAWWNGTT
ncbi:MAG: hypothetical protein H0W83_10035, partial [Planctomycetes bacterium]|nr:hypothetical protein [Planctomycetota bacterium]